MTSHTQVGVARRRRPSPSGARGDEDASQAESVIVDGLDETDEVPDLPPSEAPATSDATRAILLASARRRLVPIRRTFVQLPRNGAREAGRVGPLGRLVEERQHVALDLILLLLAIQPIISERDPLPGGTWARLLSSDSATRSPATVSRTWAVLENRKLVHRERGRPIQLLREDGSGAAWAHPGDGPSRAWPSHPTSARGRLWGRLGAPRGGSGRRRLFQLAAQVLDRWMARAPSSIWQSHAADPARRNQYPGISNLHSPCCEDRSTLRAQHKYG